MSKSLRLTILVVEVLITSSCFGQSPSGTPNPSQSSPSSAGGFSIEATIFSYQALQSNAEVIACEVAGKDKSDCIGAADKSPSDKKLPDTSEAPNIMIVPSTSNVLANFQSWRANMTVARELLELADPKCPKATPEAASFPDVATGVGTLVTAVQGAIALFANSQSAIGVAGNIQDQALVDAVARQLRGLNIQVLVPDTYGPYTLGTMDFDNSPFLSLLKKLVQDRICLNTEAVKNATAIQAATNTKPEHQKQADEASKAKGEAQAAFDKANKAVSDTEKERDAFPKGNPRYKALDSKISHLKEAKNNAKNFLDAKEKAETEAQENLKKDNSTIKNKTTELSGLQSLIASIDGFLGAVTGGGLPSNASAPSGTASPPPAPNVATPPLIAILYGDGLARKIKSAELLTTNQAKESDLPKEADLAKWRILYLKALESGGSLITKTNVLGNKVFFSGGSVATFALFALDGDLKCSGNVFDYGGFVKAEDFKKQFRNLTTDPLKQLIVTRSGGASCK
ncbi:MAG TPA: hypothetical protein VHA33_28085 [Candidatus Angelobacter sp.]|jgi:hypothetical protein|nr:hypothetical protein [Candidatus Angelobacter sp.]